MLSLTYVSSATQALQVDDLVALLEEIRPKNRALGVTGMLLYHDGNIMQNLEGDHDVVVDLFEVVAADPRHHGVIELWRETLVERGFPDWSMAFRHVRPEQLAGPEAGGHSRFLDVHGDDDSRDPVERTDSAARLLRSFRDNLR